MTRVRLWLNVWTCLIALATAWEGLKQGVYRLATPEHTGGPHDVWLAIGIGIWALVTLTVNVIVEIREGRQRRRGGGYSRSCQAASSCSRCGRRCGESAPGR